MSLSQSARRTAAAAALAAVALLGTGLAQPQKGKSNTRKANAPSLETAAQILKPPPRPKKQDLPPSTLPLQFVKGERIAILGNSTAERMTLFGHFETMLHLNFPNLELVVRNFGRPAEEVAIQQRSADYTKLDDPLYAFNPDTFLCFFGFNESFKGPGGVEKFRADYEAFIDDYSKKYPRDDAGSKPRFVLVSPMAVEDSGDPLLPDAAAQNANLRQYTAVVKAVAEKRKLAFINLFDSMAELFAKEPGLQYTTNGCHLNQAGDERLGRVLVRQLFGIGEEKPDFATSQFEKMRAAVNDKAWVHMQDHRMLNGWYVYGGRRTFDTETFPREYAKIRAMAAVRDRYVWDIAQGKPVADKPDDSGTGDLIVPPTRFGQPGQKYSEAPVLRYLSPDEFIQSCTVAPGTELKLFADETMFPELAKPVQINFDNKGRLWVACMPNYPQWKPGDPPANDRLLTFEDTDRDGKADKCTVFYDKLHCPTGFEFWNGGVLVMDQPRILFLKDTDGDGKADLTVTLLDGWASDDTHHRGGWEWSHGGLLHILEGIATSTTLETPWGPHRSQGSGGAYVYDPRTQKIRQFSLPGMANMWCYVFDEWGNGIVGDGTTANQTWDTPLSGAQFPGRKGINFILPNGVRPNLGNEWIVSRALPDHLQKQFTYACVINMNGLTRYAIREDGAGFMGERVKTDKNTKDYDDLIRSTDKHFRPCDPQIGPDGALWFGDWANALIGHMQYSQRDPNRDHVRGRIYRLVGTGLPALTPVTQAGKTIPELLEQFREYEWRTRYRARRELRDRPLTELNAAFKGWLEANANDPLIDRFRCEALWIQQSFHAVDDTLLRAALTCKTPEARAAATHILADERDRVAHSVALLIQQSRDEHPRVRTEALRGLSFFPRYDAIGAAIEVALKPLDYWTKYTLESTLGATEAAWKKDFLDGKIAANNVEASKIMTGILASSRAGNAAAPFLKQLLDPKGPSAEVKNKAMTALMDINGNPSVGRVVFQRNCTSCHKVGNGEGQEYGPNLDKVATRLTKLKLVESIIDPNADVEAKYLSTKVTTIDGQTIVGLLVGETKDELQIFDGTNKKAVKVKDIEDRKTLKQSSMPEGLAGTVSPAEFLDLMSYLYTLK
jgi:putative heme-binding domain-containing protein